ncbi:hypothetical protein ASG31_02765 [Chryseobacterium sp. Leaf404]|uniref:hypothetical protein n=1 Tax=unclassified Chryseobacterium TaxID=2593645 RepID=UPI0006F8C05C|nr:MULTISPECIES: hypothetical protein [unclassified Chryseobacterium]KQT22279.1 hypothetical protein ASG31_02765 [Chryseobacterium sp. Leaf404]
MSYPIDINRKEITYDDMKKKIIEILTVKKKPVMFSSATMIQLNGEPAEGMSHVAVICGYKKVKSLKNGELLELFKVHNSYGEKWQKENNDGWCSAYNLVHSASLFWTEEDDKPYFGSTAIKYLDY